MKAEFVVVCAVLFLLALCASVHAEQKAGPASASCQVTIVDVETRAGAADVTIALDWPKPVAALENREVTVAFLVAPESVNVLVPEVIAAVSKGYALSFPSKDLMRMETRLKITQDEVSHDAMLLLFFTRADAATDLRQPGQYKFTVPIRSGNRAAADPAAEEKVFLSVAVFKQDDPEHDQLKSAKYTLLSNTTTEAVDLK